MKPLIDRLMEQEPKRTALLLKVMKHPGTWFGSPRFDYTMAFLDGYDYHVHEHHPKGFRRECQELQYWLLHTQSASFCGSYNGWSLFYRCFGCEEEAFDAYRVFLDTSFSQDGDDVWFELHKYKSAHEIPFYIGNRITSVKHHQMAQTVLDNITELLHRSEITYDQLKIYVRRDTCFLQVRFLYHSATGWTDDTALLAKPENHDLLIAIHAHAQNTSTKALQALGFEVLDTRRRDSRSDQHPTRYDRPYAQAFAYDYEKWKTEFFPHLPPT